MYFTIKFKSIMHTKGRIVVVAKGRNILTCIYISIYVSIKVKLSFPLWTTNFCQKCDDHNLLTRKYKEFRNVSFGDSRRRQLPWVSDGIVHDTRQGYIFFEKSSIFPPPHFLEIFPSLNRTRIKICIRNLMKIYSEIIY